MKITTKGFTLVELMFVSGMLFVVITGMIKLYIYTSALADMTGNVSMAINEVQGKVEEIRNHSFADIPADYASGGSEGDVFDLTDLTGKGYITIDSTTNSELYIIEVTACWQNKYGRVVGEDQNLDGTLDLVTEDLDGDGKVSSPAKIVGMITRR